jgi:G:T-mismatch repair DNA endonuclease (very short patch repair protein)
VQGWSKDSRNQYRDPGDPKIERNVARDRENEEEWKRLVLWECQAKESEGLKQVILAFLPQRLKARTSGVKARDGNRDLGCASDNAPNGPGNLSRFVKTIGLF